MTYDSREKEDLVSEENLTGDRRQPLIYVQAKLADIEALTVGSV